MPILKYGTGGIDIVWGDDEILHEIIVSKSETDGGVHEAGGITCEATLMWDICGHFTERNHDKVADKTDEAVPEEKAERAASGGVESRSGGWRRIKGESGLSPDESCSGSDDETCSDCASEGDH